MEFNTNNSLEEDMSTPSKKRIVYNQDTSPETQQASSERPYSDKIGKGDDAKSSVVWFVITFTLTLYGCVIAAMIIVDILKNGGVNILDNIKESWAVFTPVITLSLGYMFGKQSENPEQNTRQNS